MNDWKYFDADGELVRPRNKRAAFKGRVVRSEVTHNVGSPNSAELAHWQYRDVHPIGRPDLKRDFDTWNDMKKGLAEESKPRPITDHPPAAS